MSLSFHTIYHSVIVPSGIACACSYFAIGIYSRSRGLKLDEKAAVIASLRAALLVALIAGIMLAASHWQREQRGNGQSVDHSN